MIQTARKWWKHCFSIGSAAMKEMFLRIRYALTLVRFAAC